MEYTVIHDRRWNRPIYLRSDTTDRQIMHEVLDGQYHVPPVKIVPAVVLDLGSNIGLTLEHYRMLWPKAHIVGVELDAENCLMARLNCDEPIILGACWTHTGMCAYQGEDAWGYNVAEGASRPTPAYTLYDLARMMRGADFVKMDIEGAEYGVLAQIEQWRPLVGSLLVELHDSHMPEMIELLTEGGYICTSHPGRPDTIWAVQE